MIPIRRSGGSRSKEAKRRRKTKLGLVYMYTSREHMIVEFERYRDKIRKQYLGSELENADC